MDKNKLYISSIASDANIVSNKYGLGIEISEYCTADNMDINYSETKVMVESKIKGINKFTFHGPFNELFPSAIDTKARKLAMDRFIESYNLSKKYSSKKIVFHSGFYGNMYYPIFFKERSIIFWREFMEKIDGSVEVVIENVFDNDPDVLIDIIDEVNNLNLKLCLDIGHANCYSNIGVVEWIKRLNTRIGHYHIHNNDGKMDLHNTIDNGTINMKEVLETIEKYSPNATITLEVFDSYKCIKWLIKEGYIDE